MPKPCLFCEIIAGRVPAALVTATDDWLAFLDHRPLFPGHILLVPRGHIATLEELPAPLLASLFAGAQRLARAVERALAAEGTFIALNNKVSQSVAHVHVHIVPRRKGDGLKGFFWPRTKYASDEEARAIAERIAQAFE